MKLKNGNLIPNSTRAQFQLLSKRLIFNVTLGKKCNVHKDLLSWEFDNWISQAGICHRKSGERKRKFAFLSAHMC